MTALFWMIPLMALLLVLKGFFSGSEIALVSVDKLKLRHRAKQGHRGSRLADDAMHRPERILTTTLVGTNIATVTLTTLGTLLCVHFFGEEFGDLYAVLIFTPVLLVLGEIVPKSVFQQNADAIAPVAIFPLRAFMWLFSPIVFLFSTVARFAAARVGRTRTASHLFPARDQLRHVMELAERASETQVFDRFRIERAIRFGETTVGEEMTPVSEITGLEIGATTEEAVNLVRRHGFSRLPVYEGHMGNIVGIVTLTSWDLLEPDILSRPLTDFIQPAHYVAPLQPLDEIRPVLRERSDGLAIVVDEFGSAVGMITLRDVVGAVVGEVETGLEFEDQPPRPRPTWEALGDDAFRVDGRLSISALNDLLSLDLPSTEYHTVGGMVMSRLLHLAASGESFTESGYRFTVEDATERVVRKVRIEADGK
jgi:CBS domain containing-hemolysin-like protein